MVLKLEPAPESPEGQYDIHTAGISGSAGMEWG